MQNHWLIVLFRHLFLNRIQKPSQGRNDRWGKWFFLICLRQWYWLGYSCWNSPWVEFYSDSNETQTLLWIEIYNFFFDKFPFFQACFVATGKYCCPPKISRLILKQSINEATVSKLIYRTCLMTGLYISSMTVLESVSKVNKVSNWQMRMCFTCITDIRRKFLNIIFIRICI